LLPRSADSGFALPPHSSLGLPLRGLCGDKAAVPEPGRARGVSDSMAGEQGVLCSSPTPCLLPLQEP